MPLKTCTVCKVGKELKDFYANYRSADGHGYRCKSCDDKARKKSRDDSPGTREGYRRRLLMSKYGLSLEDYDLLLYSQDGRCAICKTDNPVGEGNSHSFKSYAFAVDHCHETGEVRGLLCNPCNRGLGFFKDSPQLLGNAQRYVEWSCH